MPLMLVGLAAAAAAGGGGYFVHRRRNRVAGENGDNDTVVEFSEDSKRGVPGPDSKNKKKKKKNLFAFGRDDNSSKWNIPRMPSKKNLSMMVAKNGGAGAALKMAMK